MDKSFVGSVGFPAMLFFWIFTIFFAQFYAVLNNFVVFLRIFAKLFKHFAIFFANFWTFMRIFAYVFCAYISS